MLMDAESSLHEKLTAEYDRIKGLDAENAKLKQGKDILSDLLYKMEAKANNLEAENERLLLKHEREKNVFLESLLAASKEINRLEDEIHRLNTVVGILEAAAKARGNLITRLCDALEDGGPRPFALIKEARDAV